MANQPLLPAGFSVRNAKMVGEKLGLTTSYGVVEKALVEAYGIPADAIGAFRGRLGALQKAGLLGDENMPGKGMRLVYGPDQFHRWVLACELLEFGISPSVIVAVTRALWERRLRKIFREAEDAVPGESGPSDVILHVGGIHLMRDGWTDALPNINACPLGKLRDHIAMWMSVRPDDPLGLPPRAIITNLSMRLRGFHASLARSYMTELSAKRAAGKSEARAKRPAGKAGKHK
jgi:hypothetical protein